MSSGCKDRDLVQGRTWVLLWGLPILMIAAGVFVPSIWAFLWGPAFTIMGVACLVNASRCGRFHCYFTGPLFLLAALATALSASGLIDLSPSTIGFGALIGTTIAHVPEWVRGKYLASEEAKA